MTVVQGIVFPVRITLLNGQWFDFNVSATDSNPDQAFIKWCKVVHADRAFQTENSCIPWHAIFSISRPDKIQQQVALAQAPVDPAAAAKPN